MVSSWGSLQPPTMCIPPSGDNCPGRTPCPRKTKDRCVCLFFHSFGAVMERVVFRVTAGNQCGVVTVQGPKEFSTTNHTHFANPQETRRATSASSGQQRPALKPEVTGYQRNNTNFLFPTRGSSPPPSSTYQVVCGQYVDSCGCWHILSETADTCVIFACGVQDLHCTKKELLPSQRCCWKESGYSKTESVGNSGGSDSSKGARWRGGHHPVLTTTHPCVCPLFPCVFEHRSAIF